MFLSVAKPSLSTHVFLQRLIGSQRRSEIFLRSAKERLPRYTYKAAPSKPPAYLSQSKRISVPQIKTDVLRLTKID